MLVTPAQRVAGSGPSTRHSLVLLGVQLARAPPIREQALGSQQHHAHQRHAVQQELVLDEVDLGQLRIGQTADVIEEDVELLEQDALDHVDDERADGDAPHVAHAAQDHHRQDRERHREAEQVGLTRRSAWRRRRPPRSPADDAPSAKASSLVMTVLMPLLAAASSSSRMACHERPRRRVLEAVDRIITTVMSTAIVEVVRHRGCPEESGPAEVAVDARDERSIDARDAARAVGVRRWLFRNTMGTISPKPSVTMAR